MTHTTPSSRLIGVIREAYGLDLGGHRMSALFDCLSAVDRDVEKAASHVLQSAARLGELVECATNNETYFFRHVEQLTALRDLVAESLAQNPRPSLRVWVAGCSSGEEPLSIAAMLREAMLMAPGTRLSVLGTDLHRGMLRKAGTEYTTWSFRGVPAKMRAAHFVEHEGLYRPCSALQSLVSYRRHNLLEGPPEAVPFDVVSCRNVLIYFDAAMVKRAIELLALAVAPGGLLLLGPAESPSASLPDFDIVMRDGVVLFRRRSGPTIATPQSERAPQSVRRHRPASGRPVPTTTRRSRPPPRPRPSPPPVQDAASAHAEEQVAEALGALEGGDGDAALERLRGVIVADESNAMALYLIGSILESRGDHDHAEPFFRQALVTLTDRDPALVVPCGGGITVEELARLLSGALGASRAKGAK